MIDEELAYKRRKVAEIECELDKERKELEKLEERCRPSNLAEYFDLCHEAQIDFTMAVGVEETTTSTPYPTGVIRPHRIVPWDDFLTEQDKTWDSLACTTLASSRLFPSKAAMKLVCDLLTPVTDRFSLWREEARLMVQPAERLMDATYTDATLRNNLGLHGRVSFEDGRDSNSMWTLIEYESAFTSGVAGHQPEHPTGGGQGSGIKTPVMVIEYKSPDELAREEIMDGLKGEIQPNRDIINKESTEEDFAARKLVSGAVTQLFATMVGKGVRYGCMSTSQAYIFAHIKDDDPSSVYYHLRIPYWDADEHKENRLHGTAAAQVFAFTIQAIRHHHERKGGNSLKRKRVETLHVELEPEVSMGDFMSICRQFPGLISVAPALGASQPLSETLRPTRPLCRLNKPTIHSSPYTK